MKFILFSVIDKLFHPPWNSQNDGAKINIGQHWFFVYLFYSNSYGKRWENKMSSNFVFSELKKGGGSKAGVPVETPKGSRWGVPLLETPYFQRENTKLMQNVIFLLFFVT